MLQRFVIYVDPRRRAAMQVVMYMQINADYVLITHKIEDSEIYAATF